MATISEGDEVRVFNRSRYASTPEGGYQAVVTRVGRKYATAEYQRARTDFMGRPTSRAGTVEFDMATGYEKGDEYGNGLRVLTPAQVEADARLTAARAVLREVGVDITARSRLTGEQIEALAEVAKSFTEAATS